MNEIKRLKFIGIDSWNRPVYKDEAERLWKDVNLGRGITSLYNALNNKFDGEPDMPIKGDFEIMKKED